MFCIAVRATPSGTTLIEHFNGKAWSVMPSPNGDTFSSPGDMSHLESVACVSSARCVAVGAEIGGATRSVTVAQQIIESYNGTNWTLTQVQTSWHGQLYAVSCTGRRCLATGFGDMLPGPPVSPWSGRFGIHAFGSVDTSWSDVAPPPTFIGALSCVPGGTCFGTATGGSNRPTTVSSYRDGRWSIATLPKGAGFVTLLNGVSCRSNTQCIVVGSDVRNGNPGVDAKPDRSLIERLSGRTWKLSASPSIPGRDTELNSVSCLPHAGCLAVGSSGFFIQDSSNRVQVPTTALSMVGP
jgi:hypothetical protein